MAWRGVAWREGRVGRQACTGAGWLPEWLLDLPDIRSTQRSGGGRSGRMRQRRDGWPSRPRSAAAVLRLLLRAASAAPGCVSSLLLLRRRRRGQQPADDIRAGPRSPLPRTQREHARMHQPDRRSPPPPPPPTPRCLSLLHRVHRLYAGARNRAAACSGSAAFSFFLSSASSGSVRLFFFFFCLIINRMSVGESLGRKKRVTVRGTAFLHPSHRTNGRISERGEQRVGRAGSGK